MALLRVFLLFSSIFAVIALKSQELNRYGLEQKLQYADSKPEKAHIYYETADTLSLTDSLQSIKLIQEGIRIVQGDPLNEGIGYFYLGRKYMDYSLINATESFDKAIALLSQVKKKEGYLYLSRTWGNKAVLAQIVGDNDEYIKLFLEKAIPYAGLAGDSLRMADGYSNIAIPFMNHGNYEKAILYLHKSISIFQRLAPRDIRLVDAYAHLAKVYLFKKNTVEARKSLQAGNEILEQHHGSEYGPNFYAIEAMYYLMIKDWIAAEKSIDKGLIIAERTQSPFDMRMLLHQRAELYKAQHRWKEAKIVLLSLIERGFIVRDIDKKIMYAALGSLESELKNYEQAHFWMEKQLEVSEKIFKEETNAKIADLEAKYNYVQKENELFITQEKAKKQQIFIWVIIVCLLLSILLFYFWWRNRKIHNAQEVQSLKQQQQIELGKALLEGEENERTRIARDLHDGLGGMLAGIKLNLSHKASEKYALIQEDLQPTLDSLGRSVHELRRISRNMMPESLLQSGLEVAIRDLCMDSQVPGLQINSSFFDVEENLSPHVKVMIYRIIQELITNSIKHAAASKLMVQCTQAEDHFFITVEDNGTGFDILRTPATSQGLKNIKNRVQILNGKMEIDSSEEGTIINIELYVGHQ